MGRLAHRPLYPCRIELAQPGQVLLGGEGFRLKAAHGVGSGRWSVAFPPPHDHSHGRILGQALGIVRVLVARQAAVHRLPEQGRQLVLHVAAPPALVHVGCGHLREPQGVVQLAGCQEPSIRGDGGAAELQAHPSVKS